MIRSTRRRVLGRRVPVPRPSGAAVDPSPIAAARAGRGRTRSARGEQVRQPLVHLRGLHRRQAEAHARDVPHEAFDEAPSDDADVGAVGADVDAGENDLRMVLGERRGLAHDLVRRTAAIGPAGETSSCRRCSARRTRPGCAAGRVCSARGRRAIRRARAKRPRDRGDVTSGHDFRHRGKRVQRRRAVGEPGHASHDHAAQAGGSPGGAPHRVAQVRLRLRRHGARVEHGAVGEVGRPHHVVPRGGDRRMQRFAVVLVRATTEGAQVHLHADTTGPGAAGVSRGGGLTGTVK